jgi:hypothetical protein
MVGIEGSFGDGLLGPDDVGVLGIGDRRFVLGVVAAGCGDLDATVFAHVGQWVQPFGGGLLR